jgi:hypothetical protein
MLDREPLKRDPNTGREPETAVRPNLRARHGPCSLASRAGPAHSRPSGPGIRGIPVDMKEGAEFRCIGRLRFRHRAVMMRVRFWGGSFRRVIIS